MGLFSSKQGLCILYLNVDEVGPDKEQEYVANYKRNLYEGQGFDKFLAKQGYHFVVVPVTKDPTRLEFTSI